MTRGLQRFLRVRTIEWPQCFAIRRLIETEPMIGSFGGMVVVQLMNRSQSRLFRWAGGVVAIDSRRHKREDSSCIIGQHQLANRRTMSVPYMRDLMRT